MTEDGPDAEGLRRHMRKMLTAREYRMKYRRIDWYKPNRKQLEFHNLIAPERMLRGGNQSGKTHCLAAEMAMHSTQIYPDWHKGRTFLAPPRIERPFDFLGWGAAPNSQKARDGMQTKLLGNIVGDEQSSAENLGTGLIPLDAIIGKPAMARGIQSFVDSVNIRRESGGKAVIRFKTYEQGRQAFEGESCDAVWLDEDIKGETNASIYSECQARLTTTRGIIMVSMTPLLGLTPIRRRFKEKLPGTAEVLMTLDDVLASVGGHILDEDVPVLRARYRDWELQTRLFGADMQGEGAVFETPVEAIKARFDWREFPPYYRWIWGLDFRHSGSASTGHPFAAVLCAHSLSDNDTIYVVDAFRMKGLAQLHVERMKAHPLWRAPAAYPHDGGKGASIIAGDTIAQVYKKLDINVRPTHATFDGKDYNFEAGISLMENRFATKRLLVAQHLTELFDEYQGYHRVNGLVNKIDDDILSALRMACMDIRFAQTMSVFNVADRRWRGPAQRFARGSANHPDGEFDIFTGR